MRIAIMQPYFLPYLGYFQLISAVDRFVIYDNVKYTKKGWVNRNRFLLNGHDALFSVPLQKDSDFLDVRDRRVSDSFDKPKLLNQLGHAYARAPRFRPVFEEIKQIVSCGETNLFKYLLNSVVRVCSYLDIRTTIVTSSDVPVEHRTLKAQQKVIALCKALNATEYVNPKGGAALYDRAEFARHDLDLLFLETGVVRYQQFAHDFVPNLSILDVMMFNTPDQIRSLLQVYTLTRAPGGSGSGIDACSNG